MELTVFSLSKEEIGKLIAMDDGIKITLQGAEIFLPKCAIRATSVNRVGRVQQGSYVLQLRLFPEAAKELKNKLAALYVRLNRGEVPALDVIIVMPTTVEFFLNPVDIFGHDQRGTSTVTTFTEELRQKYGLTE